MKATPGTLRLVYGHDRDGDPRFDIYDEDGNHLHGSYTMGLWAEWRNERRGRRRLQKFAKRQRRVRGNLDYVEEVVDPDAYNAFKEQELGVGA